MGIFGKLQELINDSDDELENNEEGTDFVSRTRETVEDTDSPRKNNKVVNIHATAQLQVVLVKPERFDDVSAIADHLNDKKTVVLNLEAADRELSRRIVDFLSGATYANHGNIKKISKGTFLIVPSGVDMMGELMLDDFEEGRMYF